MRLRELLRGAGSAEACRRRRFYRVLQCLYRLDSHEITRAVGGASGNSVRARCLRGIWHRGRANVRSLLALRKVCDFRAIARIARSLFELTLEWQLIERIPDALVKIATFSQVERLRCARRMVAYREAHPACDESVALQARFIAEHAAAIEAECRLLWPGVASVEHWSGMNLQDAVGLLGGYFQEVTEVRFPELSWYTSADGVMGLSLETDAYDLFLASHLQLAAQLYFILLAAIVKEYPVELNGRLTGRMKAVEGELGELTKQHLTAFERALSGSPQQGEAQPVGPD